MQIQQKYKESFSYKSYFSLGRFISYYYQIKYVMETDLQSCAIIGVGDGLVPFYCKRNKLQVSTIDIDSNLHPDINESVLELSKRNEFKNLFDIVVCCQVLEHLPYNSFILALENLRYITKKRIIISLPDASKCFSAAGFISKIGEIAMCFQLPYKKNKHVENDEHFWEIGEREYELKRVSSDMKSALGNFKSFRNYFYPYHRFFLFDY